MTTKLFLFLSVTGAFLQEYAVGQEIKTFAMKGVRELGGSISFQNIERVENGTAGNPTTVYSIQPYFGFFIFDQVEFSIPVSFTRIRSGEEYFTELRFFLAPSYNLNIDEQTYPFLEGLFGYATQSHGPTKASSMLLCNICSSS